MGAGRVGSLQLPSRPKCISERVNHRHDATFLEKGSDVFMNFPTGLVLAESCKRGSQEACRSIVPPRTCCKMITMACRRSQLFFLFSSKTARTKSQMGAEKVDVLVSPSRGFKSPERCMRV